MNVSSYHHHLILIIILFVSSAYGSLAGKLLATSFAVPVVAILHTVYAVDCFTDGGALLGYAKCRQQRIKFLTSGPRVKVDPKRPLTIFGKPIPLTDRKI